MRQDVWHDVGQTNREEINEQDNAKYDGQVVMRGRMWRRFWSMIWSSVWARPAKVDSM